MNLETYFYSRRGTGVLATADRQGRVDVAIYARPRITSDGRLALLMRERLTYSNLQENPHAAYLFREDADGHAGVRLFLEKVGEDDSPDLVQQMTRRSLTAEEDRAKGPKHVVYFRVTKVLTLIGGTEIPLNGEVSD